MKPPPASLPARALRFRTQLLLAFMLVVSVITVGGLVLAERSLAAGVTRDLEQSFNAELAALRRVQDLRHAALVERCRALVRKSRIHAALEDGALDLLYPSAVDELRDLMVPAGGAAATGLHAEFYRLLDRNGAVIVPPATVNVGELTAAESAQLLLPRVPETAQVGYVVRSGQSDAISEIITTPIVSSETGEAIAALVLGFRPMSTGAPGFLHGLWMAGNLHLIAPGPAEAITAVLATQPAAKGTRLEIAGVPHLLFFQQLNLGSLYRPAVEVSAYPLTEFESRQRLLRWRVLGAGALVLIGGYGVSRGLAGRLSRPVEKLAVVSAENFAGRAKAEAALESTGEELQRAARFSADASHQLITPVAVMRAGLEELLAHDHLSAAERESLSVLIHQTYRLSSIIQDLLLLSRLDAGRLQLELSPVDLVELIASSVDDLSALPDASDLAVETDFPASLRVSAERGYAALILQNLLENARKYNRPAGRIRLSAGAVDGLVELIVANTGRSIPPATQAHIFERFHRGGVGENVTGYGLGLNLARQLARLHGGDLRLVRSADDWTEFAVTFRPAA